MGYERDGRYGGRDDAASRQQRQDYDRSYGSGSYGGERGYARGDDARSAYGDHGRGDYGRDDRGGGRAEYGRGGERGGYGRPTPGYGDRDRLERDRGYGREARGYGREERGFFDRAGDEVRSWFGDEEAERRRQRDERDDERDYRARNGDRDRGYGADPVGGYEYGASVARGRHDADTHYRSWRDRQMEQFDRDYDDYQREYQSRFDSEFHGYRANRQTQRDSLQRVTEHQEVVGSDGQHVGTVDKVRGDQIILTRQDQDAHGRHHAIPSSWIQSVDDKVTIGRTAEDAKAHWRDAEQRPAFGGERSSASSQASQTGQASAQATSSSGSRNY